MRIAYGLVEQTNNKASFKNDTSIFFKDSKLSTLRI
jgi:hypothetical protein